MKVVGLQIAERLEEGEGENFFIFFLELAEVFRRLERLTTERVTDFCKCDVRESCFIEVGFYGHRIRRETLDFVWDGMVENASLLLEATRNLGEVVKFAILFALFLRVIDSSIVDENGAVCFCDQCWVSRVEGF